MKYSSFLNGGLLVQASLSSASLLQIPASGKWDGDDGPWSSFSVLLGYPPQKVRLLPSFFGTTVTPIDANSCLNGSCSLDAELVYNNKLSTTWQSFGDAAGGAPLGMSPSNWSYQAQCYSGKDSISINTIDGRVLNLTKASYVTPLLDLVRLSTGMLGLNNRPKWREPNSSIIDEIVQQYGLDTSGWFYTAGSKAANRTGTLILSGYDQSRKDSEPGVMVYNRNLTEPKNYYVFLEQISSNLDGGLLEPSGTRVYLNSDTTQIWLSNQTCKNFEIAYGLVWNETYQYYLLDDAKHEELRSANHNLKFWIRSTEGDRGQVMIEVPYYALDLQVEINGINHYYYPLRPTQWTDKYVLGRSFFQAAYLAVNFDNSSFTLGQARFPESAEVPQLRSFTQNSSQKDIQGAQGRLIGGTVGGTLAGIVLLIIGFVIWRWRWRSKSVIEKEILPPESSANTFSALLHESQKPELAATPTAPPPAYRKRLWSNATTVSEVDAIDTMLTSRLDCLREELNEVPEKYTPDEPLMPPVELEGSSLSPAELDGGFRGFEVAEGMKSVSIPLESDRDVFASPPSGAHDPEHDEPVSPLASRSGSRASRREVN